MSSPFGLIPAHEMSIWRLYWVSGTPRSQAQANPCGRYKAQTTLHSSDNPRLAPRTSSAQPVLLENSWVRQMLSPKSLILKPDQQSEHALSGPRCPPREFPLCLNE